MTTAAQTLCLDPMPADTGRLDQPAATPGVSSRLRALFARIGDGVRGYDDYFAELERSLPEHVREQRRARRDTHRLMLIAMLAR